MALLVLPGLALNVAVTSSLTFDAEAAKSRPVSKVITLIKDMIKQMEKEAEEDEEIYDKLACWCETNEREKTKSIAIAEARIADFTTKTEELTASSARLGTEIENLEQEVAKNQKALAEATAIREKQLADFNSEEKDLLGSISALRAAVRVLAKHHEASFVQVPRSSMQRIATSLQLVMQKHAPLLKGVLTHAQQKVAASFIQETYAPQSGEIFGILKTMKETFEANLADTQKEEATNLKAYEELKEAKEEEIAAGQDQIDKKTKEKTDADEFLAHGMQDIEDTKANLAADETFLANLKEKCSMTDKEWEERQHTRQMEMEACSKALAILSGDDAHDLFTKTFNPAFVQKESAVTSDRRAQASKLLSAVATKLRNPALSTLALKVKLDAFTRVKKAIDDMVADLLEEKAAEIKHRDFCIAEFNENEAQTVKGDRKKRDLIASIENLEMNIKELTDAINDLKSEIAEMQLQMKRAGEDREKQNQEFQLTIADQRETQKVLKSALAVLQGFYGKAALDQQDPPAGFEAYKKNENSGGVMGMIQEIINDAKAMEAETIRSEEDAQKAYEDFVMDTNNSIEEKSKDIVNKSEDRAKAQDNLVTAKEDKDNTLLELEQLSNYNAQLHSSCDFVMKNFDIRQTARDEEVEALRQAKAILSGANFGLFLQSGR